MIGFIKFILGLIMFVYFIRIGSPQIDLSHDAYCICIAILIAGFIAHSEKG